MTGLCMYIYVLCKWCVLPEAVSFRVRQSLARLPVRLALRGLKAALDTAVATYHWPAVSLLRVVARACCPLSFFSALLFSALHLRSFGVRFLFLSSPTIPWVHLISISCGYQICVYACLHLHIVGDGAFKWLPVSASEAGRRCFEAFRSNWWTRKRLFCVCQHCPRRLFEFLEAFGITSIHTRILLSRSAPWTTRGPDYMQYVRPTGLTRALS